MASADGDGDDRIADILNDLGGDCEWVLRRHDGTHRIITDLRNVRHRYRQKNAWSRRCLLSDFDLPSDRVLLWTSPMLLPRRDDLSSLVERLCPVDHPRRKWVLASTADRRARTMHLHNVRLRHLADFPGSDADILMPACSWCGLPTGIYCEGFKSFRRRPGVGPKEPVQYVCGRPVCSTCEEWTGSCFQCSLWVGMAKQLTAGQPQEVQT